MLSIISVLPTEPIPVWQLYSIKQLPMYYHYTMQRFNGLFCYIILLYICRYLSYNILCSIVNVLLNYRQQQVCHASIPVLLKFVKRRSEFMCNIRRPLKSENHVLCYSWILHVGNPIGAQKYKTLAITLHQIKATWHNYEQSSVQNKFYTREGHSLWYYHDKQLLFIN